MNAQLSMLKKYQTILHKFDVKPSVILCLII